MAARNRLPPWHEKIRIDDGREMLIRPVRPDDALPLRAGFALMEPRGLRNRIEGEGELSQSAAERLTHPDPRREFTLIASEPLPAGEAMIGAFARIVMTDDAASVGDIEIVVARFVAGMGLGRHLMRRMVRWGRGKTLDRLVGEVAADNLPMLALAKSLDFREQPSTLPGFVQVVLDLK
ncbi:MAG: GNAT family N-acetyltransferase [Luteimonas sp.]